jgi:hypothetical protein
LLDKITLEGVAFRPKREVLLFVKMFLGQSDYSILHESIITCDIAPQTFNGKRDEIESIYIKNK